MNRRDFLGTAIAGTTGLGFLSGCKTAGRSGNRPNVVYVFADQWRASSMGYAGNPDVKTPNLDAFQKECIDFVSATSVCPVCSPARGSMVTGKYPLSHGVFVNDVHLADKEYSIAEHFSKNGYRTGYIGKWHLDGNGREAYIPAERRQGFEFWQALECSHNYNHSPYYDNNDPEKRFWEGYDAFDQTEHAVSYLKKNKNNPFMLWLAWGPPHSANKKAPEVFSKLYDPQKLTLRPNVPKHSDDFKMKLGWYQGIDDNVEEARALLAGYYAHISAVDACFGKLRQAIRSLGLDENTIIVFTSDHGGMVGSHGLWNKQQPYDESVRIPFLLKVPGMAARIEKSPINTPDIMPTLCGLCGLNIPDSVEGRDYTPLIKGQPFRAEPSLIANYHPFGQCAVHVGGKEWRGLRTEQYTYVRDRKGSWLLFDNLKDPYQLNNLVDDPDFHVLHHQMDQRLDEKLAERNDAFLSGLQYIKQWGYPIDETGTVPIL